MQKQFSPVYTYYYNMSNWISFATLLGAVSGRFPPILELGLAMFTNYFNYALFGKKPKDFGNNLL